MSETMTLSTSVTLVLHECGNCGVMYGITERMYKERREDGELFWCPNGHRRAFVENEVQRLQKRLDRSAQLLAQAEGATVTEKQAHSTTKGKLTRARKRAEAAVCPHCNRTIRQMAQHLKTMAGRGQHPS